MSRLDSRLKRLETRTDASVCTHLPARVIWPDDRAPDNRVCDCGRDRLTIQIEYTDTPADEQLAP